MGWASLREDIVERLTQDLNAIRNNRSSDAGEVQKLKVNSLIKTCESILRALSKDLELATDPSIDLAIQVPGLKKELDKLSEKITELQQHNRAIESELGKERKRAESLTKQLDATRHENSHLKEDLEGAMVKLRMISGEIFGIKDEASHPPTLHPKRGKQKGKDKKGGAKREPSIDDFAKTLSSKWKG